VADLDYAPPVGKCVRRVLSFFSLILLAGCGLAPDGGPQPAPPDAVELSVYMRDLSRLPHYFLILGAQLPDEGR